MKKLVCLLTGMAAFAICSTSNASITNAWWYADGDGVIDCTTDWNGGATTLSMEGIHYDVSGSTVGHMLGTVELDSIEDPTLTLNGSVDNQTGNSWYGYQINVVMNMPFTFVAPGPSVENPPNYDWFVANVVAPTDQGGGVYKGELYFSKGTSILTGDTLNFEYSINFAGTMGFSFTQEMIPWFTVIPEPSTIVLAGIGGLMLTLRVRRNRLT